MFSLKTVFHATVEEIAAADTWLDEIGRSWGIPERTAFGARVCIAEIVVCEELAGH